MIHSIIEKAISLLLTFHFRKHNRLQARPDIFAVNFAITPKWIKVFSEMVYLGNHPVVQLDGCQRSIRH
jgi:hypothetical protein